MKFITFDSTSPAGQSNPNKKVAANARSAAKDPLAVYYIGELGSGASQVSMPILNRAGIAQVSPSATYVGLTTSMSGVTAPGEPRVYYPTGKRTFLRNVAPKSRHGIRSQP